MGGCWKANTFLLISEHTETSLVSVAFWGHLRLRLGEQAEMTCVHTAVRLEVRAVCSRQCLLHQGSATDLLFALLTCLIGLFFLVKVYSSAWSLFEAVSPVFLTPRTSLVEDTFSTDGGWARGGDLGMILGMVWGWFKHITFTVDFIIVTSAPPQIIRH